MKLPSLVVAVLVLVCLGGSYVTAAPFFPGFPFMMPAIMGPELLASILPSVEKMVSNSMPHVEKMVSSSMPVLEQMVVGAMPTVDKVVSSYLTPSEKPEEPPKE